MEPTFASMDQGELVSYHLTSQLVADEFVRRSFAVEWLTSQSFLVDLGTTTVGFSVTRGPLVDLFANHVTTHKDLTRTLLAREGVEVPVGRAFLNEEEGAANDYADDLGWPLVVKPASGSAGKAVTVGINSREEFGRAWRAATQARGRRTVVERHFEGTEARFCVVAGECVAVVGKLPPSVVGDGEQTIGELLAAKNADRRRSREHRSRPIRMTPHRLEVLRMGGRSLETVPEPGERVTFDSTGNLSRGAEAIDLTDDVHKSFLQVAGKAARAVPGLNLAGVDIMARDFARPAKKGNYIVIELNSWPGISGHHFPGEGRSRDVAARIVDAVLKVKAVPEPGGEQRSSRRRFRRRVSGRASTS